MDLKALPSFRINFILLVLCGSLLSSCASDRRNQLHLTPYHGDLNFHFDGELLVFFDSSVEGRPLNETVWDNVQGAFWDEHESKLIGFTQNYKPQFFMISPVLLPIAAKNGANLIDSRIVIPFGNIFSSLVTSAIRKNKPDARICYDKECVSSSGIKNILRVKVDQFFVWEAPLNHLNFYIECSGELSKDGVSDKQYRFTNTALEKELGGVLSTHKNLISKMNKHSNEFAEEAVTELLMNLLFSS